MSIRGLARRHRVHRRTVRQALRSALPPPRKRVPRLAPQLGPHQATIPRVAGRRPQRAAQAAPHREADLPFDSPVPPTVATTTPPGVFLRDDTERFLPVATTRSADVVHAAGPLGPLLVPSGVFGTCGQRQPASRPAPRARLRPPLSSFGGLPRAPTLPSLAASSPPQRDPDAVQESAGCSSLHRRCLPRECG